MTAQAFRRLYIHVPFCRAKCDYCAFYSEAPFRAERCEQYLDALDAELDGVASRSAPLRSLFIGGGTPTLLGPRRLQRLLPAVRRRFDWAAEPEWTCESTPATLSRDMISTLAAAGVNRLSVGVQTFSEALRRSLGRRDSATQLGPVLEHCRACGIERLNLDLIYGIPGQTLGDWEHDLVSALDFGIEHLSAYCLTIEEGTRLGRRETPPPDDSAAEAMWRMTDEVAARYGLERYEISNFCKPGAACRHNVGIWLGDTYAGCGPAASSFNGVERRQNPACLDAWLGGAAADVDRLPAAARAAEILAFGLRLRQGWCAERFHRVTGFDMFELRASVLYALAEAGLLRITSARVHPTEAGLRLNDTIAEELLLSGHDAPASA